MIQRRPGWLSAQVGEEIVMMSVETGDYVGLNSVGARIWELIEAPAELDELCARLEGEFEAPPEVCRRDVETFLAELEARRLITR